ncbi:MAG: hypothetical protein ISS79_10115 [Phycisphaerae bacterium]|nr:hypothetical protein [Phycisphaerae bacterium]
MQIGDQYLGRANWNISIRDVFNPSVLSLLASNAVLIIWALIERWPLPFVICVYWAQSVIIGIFWFLTILTYGRIYKSCSVDGYEEYSTLKPTDRAGAALIFALHYGVFHAFYLFWMLRSLLLPMMNRMSGGDAEISISDFPLWTLLIFTGIFFISRLFTFIRERKEYARNQANIAKLTFFPYARIVPMHAATFVGASLQKGNITPQSALLFFLLLKTGADVFMHIVQKKGFADDIEDPVIDGSAPRVAATPDGPVLLMPGGQRILLADKPEIVQKLRNIARFPKDIRLQVCQGLLGIKNAPQQSPPPPEMKCQCSQTDFIEGQSAQKYADGHLEWLETADDTLTSRYICPETRKTWVMVAGALKAEQPESDEALCRCAQIERLDGKQAQRYAKEHLKAVETDGGWRTTYICPYTDKRWLLDYTKITDVNLAEYARLQAVPPTNEQSLLKP